MLLYQIKEMNRLLLIRVLSQQDAWVDVAKLFGLNPGIDLKEPSADSLIKYLENRNCTLENLEKCLRALNLLEALSIINKPEKLRIVRQPYCVVSEDIFKDGDALCVRAGGRLHLKIEAVGCPFLSYQWFRDNIPLSKTSELVITNFSEEMEGLYYCIIQQLQDIGWKREVTSTDVTVKTNIKVLQEAPRLLSWFPSEKCELECGQTLTASIEVIPNSETTFSWRHNCKLLGYTSNKLEIPNVNEEYAGTYECHVKNRHGEVTKVFQFDVKAKRPSPTAKRALIVTNSLYQHKTDQLQTPQNDAKTLDQCLSRFGFKCTKKRNRSAEEMKEDIRDFFKGVEKGAFVLFYFGGHGCMVSSSSYMMGCDADLTNVSENQVVHANILEEVQICQPLLFISILDMCQLQNKNLIGKQSNNKWDCNVIQCCATSQNRQALEPMGAANGNSVYMKHFEKIINTKTNISFLGMVGEVHLSVEKETKNEQKPSITLLIGRGDFQLSDPIEPLPLR